MDRVTFLKNKEPYGSLELAKQALNYYAEANSLLDGEPIIGRYLDGGEIKLVFAICTVLAVSESGCVTSEKLTFFIDEESIDSLQLENLTDVDVLSKLEGDVLFYDGEKWINKPNAVFDGDYVHTDNNFTNDYKEKLEGIETGAEANVQSDWEEYNEDSDSFIRNKPTIPAAQVNSDWNATSGVAEILNKPDVVLQTEFLEHTQDSVVHVSSIEKETWNNKLDNVSVGGVDVTIGANNTAEIPTANANTEGTLSSYDWVTFNSKYSKPNGGIPKSDLAQNVQTSLDKADTALQESDISDMQTKSNKVNSWSSTTSNDKYPSEKLVKDSLDQKQATLSTQTPYTTQGTSTKVPQITTNTLGQVTGITEINIDFPTIPSGSGSVIGNATSFVKDVTLTGHTLSGNIQATDSSIDENSSSLPTSQAVRSFVNSSINNMAAYYMTRNQDGDPFDSNAQLMAATVFYSGGVEKTPTLNDYTIVVHDETQPIEVAGYSSFANKHDYIGFYVLISGTYTLVTDSNYNTLSFTPGIDKAYELPSTRYINTSSSTTPSWSYQYIINNTGLTASQIAAVNSGINATKVSSYDGHISDTDIHVTTSDKTFWNQKLNPVNQVTDDTSKNYVTSVTQNTNGQISVSKGTLATIATSGNYNDLLNKPTIPSAPGSLDTTAVTSQSTSSSESLSGNIILHKVSKTGSYSDLLDKPTIPTTAVLYTQQTLTSEQQAQTRENIGAGSSDFSGNYNDLTNKPVLNTNNSQSQTANSSETITGTINLHKVSKTGSYSDLLDKPTIPAAQVNSDWNATSGVAEILNKPTIPSAPGTLDTTASSSQSTSSSESLSGNIILHKVSKTGSYSDLLNKPTIPAAQVNSDWNATSGVAEILNKPTIPAAQVNSDWNATSGVAEILNKPTIPSAPGTLITDNTQAQTTSSGESLSGTINLHKVAKTGTYNDLLGKPTIPLAPGTLNTNNTQAQSVNSSESLSGLINLHKVSKTGSYSDLLNKPTIPAAQVNSDWNATSGVAEILNKPTLAAVATSGSYNDLTDTPTIPVVNDGTLTIKQNGELVGTFTANTVNNVDINVTDTTYAAGDNIIIDSSEPHDLPEGYTELFYIESDGTAYINTGINCASLVNARIVTKFQKPSTNDYDVFGSDVSGDSGIIWDLASNNVYLRWFTSTSRGITYQAGYNASTLLFNNTFHTLDVGGVDPYGTVPIKKDGVLIGNFNTVSSTNVLNKNIYVFRSNRNYYGTSRFSTFTIYSNDVKVFDGVSCKNDLDELGMYDFVSETFFTNAGSNSFTAGPILTESNIISVVGLSTVATSGSYNDLINKPTIPSAPGTLNTTATTAQTTSSSESLSGNVTLHKVSKTGTYSDLIGTPNLATVATSGSYNDLTNQPTIPNIPTQTGQSGKFLTTDGTDMSWATVSVGSSTLSDLTDTTITTPTDGQVLTYDNSTSKWVNAAPTGGSSITMRVWTNS